MNFAALRLLISFAQDGLTLRATAESIGPVWAVMALAVILHGIIFFWQAVGVLRATEAMVADTGDMYLMWGAQLALILAAFWALTYTLHAWYWTRADLEDHRPTEAEVRAERAARYDLSVEGTEVTLTGPIELGVTERFRGLLARNPGLTEIRLTSTGGNIYEARGLASLIRQNGLATLAVDICSSACTTVFIGGRERRLAAGARLGFHQYRIDVDYAVLNADPEAEQARDRALFRAAGVADWFLRDMHRSGADGMWFPETDTLLKAGVLTHPVQWLTVRLSLSSFQEILPPEASNASAREESGHPLRTSANLFPTRPRSDDVSMDRRGEHASDAHPAAIPPAGGKTGTVRNPSLVLAPVHPCGHFPSTSA